MEPRINIDDPAVQEACAAILREVLLGVDEVETWKLIAVGAARWMIEDHRDVSQR